MIHGNIFCQDHIWIPSEKKMPKHKLSGVFVLLYWYMWFTMRNDYNIFVILIRGKVHRVKI